MKLIAATLLFAASFVSAQQVPNPADATPPARWLVQLRTRSFELAPLRDAIVERTDRNAALALIDEFERRSVDDHAAFVREAEQRGARVLKHWWIVNGCHVEASSAVAEQLAALPEVVRIDADEMAYATGVGSNRPLDHFNHGTEFVHGIGIDGRSLSPSVIAIMDAGVDENMNGLGRPHRTFYPGGDPANTTGGGIAGSRLLYNSQFGSLGPDDPQGHGNSVAAIAAGDRWGTTSSVAGHAKGAQLASYCILDSFTSSSVGALYSTMASAWQQMLVDRASYNIVVANNSFGGEPDSQHFVQQALDNTAWVGDILVCVSAGNSGPNASTGQQSAVNGLAVAAAAEDSHRIFSVSSRGPVFGDLTRTYPDITAIGIARVPRIDCETTESLFSRTSCAAARVAGGAMLLRASVPMLRADETKAILLASTLDIAAANPGLDENAYGTGLLRDDRALLAAADLTRHARFTLNGPGQFQTLGVGAIPGQRVSIAIAWMRPQATTANWSNLNLSVRDGATFNLLASSNSPRNLYEKVTVIAPPSGLLVVTVLAASISNGTQEFALAVADLPPGDPMRGEFTDIGAGCEGPQPNVDPYCDEINANVDASDLLEAAYSSRFENVIQLTAPASGMTLTGFELFLRGSDDEPLDAHVFLDDGSNFPHFTPVRSSPMPIDTNAAWRRTTFPALTLAPLQNYWIGVSNWNQTYPTLSSVRAPTTLLVRGRDRCDASPAWTRILNNPAPRIGVRTLCAGPPRGDVPLHRTVGDIRIGESCALEVERVPPGTNVVLALGFSSTIWTGGSLPFDLSTVGGSGCQLRVEPGITILTTADAAGRASIPARIAPDPAIVGWTFYTQFLPFDPTSARPLTASNAGRNLIGTR